VGLFDGTEELNATEVLKRGLHQVLDQVLGQKIQVRYPDLSSGVAGWIKQLEEQEINRYEEACRAIFKEFCWVTEQVRDAFWGIPWIDDNQSTSGRLPNPRLLNAGWLIDEFPDKDQCSEELSRVKKEIQKFFRPGNNPTDWYVLAAGDGDSMGEWLKGTKLKEYEHYIAKAPDRMIPDMPVEVGPVFQDFLKKVRKRMGPATHAALSRALLDFSNQLVPYLTEERYAGRLIYGGGDDVLAYTNLWEWDSWLWDIRQCFKGAEDPQGEFSNPGDYWQWVKNKPASLPSRPLFTMGSTATISFGIVIAHHSVPLAIALENLWEAEEEAKEHESPNGKEEKKKKDAVQVRVLYGNGNILKSTAKFATFDAWRSLLTSMEGLEPALFEQVAQVWEQHPAPVEAAIQPWVKAFCDRRDLFEASDDRRQNFNGCLVRFLSKIWETTSDEARGDGDRQIRNWLKLAAFILRNRDIRIIKHQGVKS